MNTMTLNQASTLLNGLVSQMTGQASLTAITNNAQWISVAETVLQTGRDPVINALSQVWSRTIFAVREYNAKNGGLRMALDRYGNAIRKLSPIAAAMEDDEGYTYPAAYDGGQLDPFGTGQSVDPWVIKKQKVLQTNFYGSNVFAQHYSVFADQFEVAFSDPAEFVRFNAMNLTERRNDKESFEESIAKGLQANYIGAIIDENATGRVIHLLTEYNTITGQTLTAQTVMQAGNFEAFIRWMYSRIRTIVRRMGVRSEEYQTVITGNTILRHTSPENMRVALSAPILEMIDSMVLSGLYHDDYMRLPQYEAVEYWQSIKTPDSISLTPVYTDTSGNQKTGSAVSQGDIVGVIHDRDAIGYAITREDTNTTPLNPRARYWNTFVSATFKTITDMTEKGVVLLMD